MNTFVKIICWISFSVFMLMALASLTSGGLGILGTLLFVVGGFLAAPFDFARKFRKKIKKPLSICLIVALFIIGCLLLPTSEEPTIVDGSSSIHSSTINSDSSNNPSSDAPESTDASENDSSDDSSSTETSSEPSSNANSTTNDTPSSNANSSTNDTPSANTKPNISLSSSEDDQGNDHTHSYSNATCTTPQTCSGCGATVGSANGHNWKDATYSAPKTCTVCGTTEGVAVTVPGKENYHGHVYTGGSSSKRFHYEAQCAGSNSHEITWDEVTSRSLTACGTCVLK